MLADLLWRPSPPPRSSLSASRQAGSSRSHRRCGYPVPARSPRVPSIGPGTPGAVNYLNDEVEPWVAVNPANPLNVIGVWQQDRWSDGGARGLATGYSTNGGATWNTTFARFTFCSGGTVANGGDFEARASDPWVTFSPNGAAYQIAIAFNGLDLTNAVTVSKSHDRRRDVERRYDPDSRLR